MVLSAPANTSINVFNLNCGSFSLSVLDTRNILVVANGACVDQIFSAICSASVMLFYPIIHVKLA
jgi:hypothetical protein